jgi:hypothetical protein
MTEKQKQNRDSRTLTQEVYAKTPAQSSKTSLSRKNSAQSGRYFVKFVLDGQRQIGSISKPRAENTEFVELLQPFNGL